MGNTGNNNKIICSLVLKIAAVVSAVYGLYWSLSTPKSLSYFTTLSNIAIVLILIVFIAADMIYLSGDGKKDIRTNGLYLVKYVLTVSITITFLVFGLILAPTMQGGIWNAYFAYHGYSFCLHFLTPVLAIIDFLMFDTGFQSERKHALLATIPAMTYAFCVAAAGYAGVRWGNMSAPYNFLNFGAETGWFGFDLSLMGPESLGIGVAYMIALLFLIFWGLGALYLLINRAVQKKR